MEYIAVADATAMYSICTTLSIILNLVQSLSYGNLYCIHPSTEQNEDGAIMVNQLGCNQPHIKYILYEIGNCTFLSALYKNRAH